MSLPVVGARISLVSKSNIRFVGTLHSINHEESSVSLEQVFSFGTEGRAGRPDMEIPPQPQVFPLIVFKGTDVKDLKVEESPQMPPQPHQQPWGFQSNQSYFNPYQMQNQPPPPQSYWQPPPSSVALGPPPGYGSGGLGFSGPVHTGFQTVFGSSALGGFAHQQQSYVSNNMSMGNLNPTIIASSRPPVRIEQPKQQSIRIPGGGGPNTAAATANATTNRTQEPSAPPPVNAAITFGKTGFTNSVNSVPQSGAPWNTGSTSLTPLKNSDVLAAQPSSAPVVKSALQLNPENEPPVSATTSDISPASASTPQRIIQLKDLRSGRSKSDAVVVEKTFADFEEEDKVKDSRPRQTSARNGNHGNNTPARNGNHGNNTRQTRHHYDRGGDTILPPRTKMVIPNEEFDFEKSNAKFARDEEAAEDIGEVEETRESVFYKKSSFFDDLSSDNKDRAAKNQETFDRRAKMSEDRQLNMETFGQAGIRRGRGRGRGGSMGRGRFLSRTSQI